MVKFEELRQAFRGFFQNRYGASFSLPCFRSGDNWEYAVVKGSDRYNGNVHFELIHRGAEDYIELHVETYPRFVSEWNLLQKTMAENSRRYVHFTYYSSNYWRTRTPVVTLCDLKEDLTAIVALVEPIFDGAESCRIQPEGAEDDEPLPFQRNPSQVAKMLSDDGILKMPAVQRGKVWNASRIEALWDSILRGFSIGAFSVQRVAGGGLDLLDGQQRSSAIAIGYAPFPPQKGHELDSILWMDLAPEKATLESSQKKFMLYVSTASHPWGYAASSDETRNVLLSASERRSAVGKIEHWHKMEEKPYPGELFPARAGAAVPFSLLLKYVETDENRTLADFVAWCKLQRGTDNACWWNWLERFENQLTEERRPLIELTLKRFFWDGSENSIGAKRREDMLREYPVFFIDAGSVEDGDVALYFTRIGKGGVRPSDEELAYSVLKSKLGVNFKQAIERISDKYGLAQPSRIAHLAIRCFKTIKSERFFKGSILDEVIGMCRRGSDGTRTEDYESFISFVGDGVTGEFVQLIEAVQGRVFAHANGLTDWHRTKFCQYHDGDIYLYLLWAARRPEEADIPLAGVSALIYERAMNPDRTIRFIMEEGVRRGIAHSMRETYRGEPRFARVPQPSRLNQISGMFKNPETPLVSIKDKARESGVASLIASGYGNQKAYSMLLYACRDCEGKRFGYNPWLGVFSEDNCPWDYDHILPHSWVDKMASGEECDVCNWLKNSIGNLAPLPFEINRSLSDDSRDSSYPFCKCVDIDNAEIKKVQMEYCLDGDVIGRMAEFCSEDADARRKAVRAFCSGTVQRFAELYRKWYTELGIAQILDFARVDWESGVRKRMEFLLLVKKHLPESEWRFHYWRSADNREETLDVNDPALTDWYVWDWLSLTREIEDVAVEVMVRRDFLRIDYGLCKRPSETGLRKEVVSSLPGEVVGLPEKSIDSYWYAVRCNVTERDASAISVAQALRRVADFCQRSRPVYRHDERSGISD